MGNQPQSTKRQSKQSRLQANSFSLDQFSMKQKLNNKILPEKSQTIKLLNQSLTLQKYKTNHSQSQLIKKQTSKAASYSSHQNKIKKSQNDAKLYKLNKKNDQLRNQLIKLSDKLTQNIYKHQNKNIYNRKKQNTQITDSNKIEGLKRQLENAYKQVDRYKKILSQKKQLQNPKDQQSITKIQNKITNIDTIISKTIDQIQTLKNIQKYRFKNSKRQQSQAVQQEQKALLQKLKNQAKSYNKKQKQYQTKQKLMQQYMIKLQRKRRQIFGQYVPQLKSYANKNFQPQSQYQKRKSKNINNYQPADWQIHDAEDELKSLKLKHEQYHNKIQKILKFKNTSKQEQQNIKQQIQKKNKIIQNLKYKLQRYTQMKQGNFQVLLTEEEQLYQQYQQYEDSKNHLQNQQQIQKQKNQIKTIIKGKQIQNQNGFNDHNLIKNLDYHHVSIICINVWFTNKQQIAAIQMIYSNGKDKFQGKKSSNTSAQMQKQTFQLEDGDYVRNFAGVFNKKGAIQHLIIETARQKLYQVGKQLNNGLNFNFNIQKGQKPVCVSGYSYFDGSYWRINQLQIDVLAQ